jgi:hypothetical protein
LFIAISFVFFPPFLLIVRSTQTESPHWGTSD